MSKPKNERRVSEDRAMARASTIRSSARKLNLVAASIRGKSAAAALTQLTFEKRRVAGEVRKVLQAAIANAENNHALNVDKLIVDEAYCGRAFVMKRFQPRGRGRSSGIEKPFSNLTIIVRENKEESKKREKRVSKKETTSKAPKKAAAGA
ncbi:MAG: 50S ribosomal protein L22 [Alphaproteobacteria bacterium]|nr:50S ribosomal protein L22 [Alphaproteobacteria bacterium]